jgi:WD40 repeat protein
MLMLTILVMVEPAGAAFPGQNGKIAFTSNRDGNFEIYTMNPNGQGVDRLTNNPAEDDSEPSWSPDGNKIVFGSRRDGNLEIYTMNANGQGIDRLTNNPAADLEADWSPGGGKIVFTSARDSDNEIYTMNANGQGIDRLTNNPANDFFPDWQPLSPAPNPTPPNNDTKAPKVLNTSPKANAKGVAPTSNITATFSKKMRPASVKSAFELFEKKKGSTTTAVIKRVEPLHGSRSARRTRGLLGR